MNTATIYVEMGDTYGERNTVAFTGEPGSAEDPVRQAFDYVQKHEWALAPGEYVRIARDLTDDPAHFADSPAPETGDQVAA